VPAPKAGRASTGGRGAVVIDPNRLGGLATAVTRQVIGLVGNGFRPGHGGDWRRPARVGAVVVLGCGASDRRHPSTPGRGRWGWRLAVVSACLPGSGGCSR
jgi:hypothetical protein